MADMTITWKGGVPVDSLGHTGKHEGQLVRGPSEYPHGEAVPMHSGSLEASMQAAVPYISAEDAEDGDYDWAEEFEIAKGQ